jgi:translation initiation factor RLI1
MQNSTIIPKNIKVELHSEVFNTFRCQSAANSLDIDVKKKSVHKLEINNININDDWNIGLIYGASGSGKTTLAKKLFGENIFDISLDENLPILEQLPKEYSYEDCANILNGIGLNSVVCWIRPIKTLSNVIKGDLDNLFTHFILMSKLITEELTINQELVLASAILSYIDSAMYVSKLTSCCCLVSIIPYSPLTLSTSDSLYSDEQLPICGAITSNIS